MTRAEVLTLSAEPDDSGGHEDSQPMVWIHCRSEDVLCLP